MASISGFIGRRCSICSISTQIRAAQSTANLSIVRHTRDVLLENVIFGGHIVEDLLAVFVHNKHFPLISRQSRNMYR